MGGPVITLALLSQEDVLLTRRRARDLAGFLQLGAEAQSRLATAVWEVARLALRGESSQVSGAAVPAADAATPCAASTARTADVSGRPADGNSTAHGRDAKGDCTCHKSSGAPTYAYCTGLPSS